MMSMSNMGICGEFQLGCWISKSYVKIVKYLQPFACYVVFPATKNPPIYRRILKLYGAGDGTRTRDTLLGRQALYH